MSIDDEVFEDLLAKVEQGAPLRAICCDDGIPDIVVLQKYMRQNPALMARLRDAKKRAKERMTTDAVFRDEALANRKQFIEGQSDAREES